MKEILKSLLPARWLHLARMVYSPVYREGLDFQRRQQLVASSRASLLNLAHGCVTSGPFAGMRCADASVCSAWTPKILGTYEKELHEVFEGIFTREYECVIDIGAAEGYYAIGLALHMPRTRVIAYEATEEGRQLLQNAAAANDARVDLRGLCKPEDLQVLLQGIGGQILILCDAEGAEVPILAPEITPDLLRCDILVELHPWAVEKPRETLESRFSGSADITLIKAMERTAADFPGEAAEAALDDEQKLACMDEERPPNMEWLWIRPRER